MTRFAMGALVILVLLSGCATNMAPSEQGNSASGKRVLIAGENTEFKQRLAAAVIEKLGTQDWYFRIIGLDQLAQIDTGSYQAIVVLAGYRAGRLDGRVQESLKRDPSNHKVIVLYTRGTDDPTPPRAGLDLKVDAISSASRNDRVDARAEQLATLIKERF